MKPIYNISCTRPGRNFLETGIKEYIVKPLPLSESRFKLEAGIFEYFFPGASIIVPRCPSFHSAGFPAVPDAIPGIPN